MRRTLVLSLAAALLLGAETVSAQADPQPSDTWKLMAKRHDKNGDGEITADEYTRGKETFQRLDRNRDGVLSATDFAGGRQRGGRGGSGGGMRRGMAGRIIGRLADDNGDRTVSQSEWKSFIGSLETNGDEVTIPGMNRPRMTQFLDQDGDGKLEVSDLQSLFAQADVDKSGALEESELGGRRGGRGGRGGQGGRGGRSGQDGEPGQDGQRGGRPGAALPQPGDTAPDFTLPFVDNAANTAQLSSFVGKKPVALIFGSYT